MRKKLLLFLTMGLLLAGCSVSEMNDSGMLNVSIGDDGRYIAGGSSRVDNAYLGLIDQDVLYNFDEMETVQAEIDGTILHTFSGVPVGDYTFIAMLMDADDHNIAMALDPVTIEEGLNELVVEMGPRIHPGDRGDWTLIWMIWTMPFQWISAMMSLSSNWV